MSSLSLPYVAHIGHAELLTPSPDATFAFAVDVLGLREVARDGDSVYLRGYGDYVRTSLKITEAAEAGLGHLGLRTRTPQALDEAVRRVGDGSWMDGDIGHGPAFACTTPAGHRLELYFETERHEHDPKQGLPKNQYDPRGGHGIEVKRLDHINLFVADVAGNREFAERCLGYRCLDVIIDDDGHQTGAFTTASIAPLELVFVKDAPGRGPRLHHLAFWVDSREDVLRAADVFADCGVTIEVPPAKHTIGSSFFLYGFEPGGNRVEVTTGSDFNFDPDSPPRVWTSAERRSGIGWGTKFPDTWVSYGTPA